MIEVKDLNMRFGRVQALQDVSFTVAAGDVFGFIGPNGAGKTTTIRILATVQEPTSGRAFVDGHCVVNEPERVRESIGYMPDEFGVYEGVRVEEYLDFFAGAFRMNRKTRRRACEDVLELTDMKELRARLVSELSKGMRQRLCVAKTLLHDPKVLILDEPAAGLDPRARIELRALLRELANMGKTIFISSHILTELADLCNSVGIIEKGRILAAGEIGEITARLTPARHVLIRVLGRAEEAVKLLREDPMAEHVQHEDGAIRVCFQGDRSQIHRLVKRLTDADIPIVGLEEQKADLEDVFMKITRGEVS